MSADDAAHQRVIEQLREITRLAGEVASAGGSDDALGVRNRAVEIAAMAQTLVWVVEPEAADWTLDIYRSARAQAPRSDP